MHSRIEGQLMKNRKEGLKDLEVVVVAVVVGLQGTVWKA